MLDFNYMLTPKALGVVGEVPPKILEHESMGQFLENCLTQLSRSMGGLEGKKLRIFNRVLNKLDVSVARKVDLITLDKEESELVKELLCSDGIRIDPAFARAIYAYQIQLETCTV